jgi:murein L,D-transpeptidase YafK
MIKAVNLIIIIILLFIFSINTIIFAQSNNKTLEQIKTLFSNNNSGYLLYISKKKFALEVYNREIKIIANYKIGYGLNPDKKAKLYGGDNRTPEGVYKITEILSIDAEKNSVSYKKLKEMNNIYFKAIDGHYKFGNKKTDLGYNVYGPRFFRINYPNENDISRYNAALKKGEIPLYKGKILSIGAGLAIHGNNDNSSIGELSSSGCVRMNNREIIELDKYIELNTPVIISKD